MATYFSESFNLSEDVVEEHGAFNISLVTDLPLFIDPFLLFNSKRPEYQALHDEIIRYLVFLRDKSRGAAVDPALLAAWYCFHEVKQTWLGFSRTDNRGSGLGMDFANALNASLKDMFGDFGAERVTRGSHLEKVCLIREGIGRDNISDFTTNLIKGHLCGYTESFAQARLAPDQRRSVAVRGASFNYDTETWETRTYELPWWRGDYVILTPKDMLTRDENWINRHDLVRSFEDIPTAIPDAQLRAQVENHFQRQLARHTRKGPTQRERDEAAARTIADFPQLIDYFIRLKELRGDQAESLSSERVRLSEALFVNQCRSLQGLLAHATAFYGVSGSSYEEAHARLAYLKDVIENKGGHRLFYKDGEPIQREADLQVMYRLVWFGTPSDVSAEANDGRGPADYKISRGASDKTIVEMKLAKNSRLKDNLLKQAEIYKAASDARNAIKVVLYFTITELQRVRAILDEVGLTRHRDVVLIDARADNKPSGSKA
ncbi:hypothetical protein NF552_22705 (plasmid) [Roseomonas mucosa]|nr:hypothetical protein NF552_22705 [Roseomonas mucosa]